MFQLAQVCPDATNNDQRRTVEREGSATQTGTRRERRVPLGEQVLAEHLCPPEKVAPGGSCTVGQQASSLANRSRRGVAGLFKSVGADPPGGQWRAVISGEMRAHSGGGRSDATFGTDQQPSGLGEARPDGSDAQTGQETSDAGHNQISLCHTRPGQADS